MELPPGCEVAAVTVPPSFVGKTLRELDVRGQHQLLVVGVRSRAGGDRTSPDPQIPLGAGSVLVVEGPSGEVQWLRALG